VRKNELKRAPIIFRSHRPLTGIKVIHLYLRIYSHHLCFFISEIEQDISENNVPLSLHPQWSPIYKNITKWPI
jgi:hypothetical protein